MIGSAAAGQVVTPANGRRRGGHGRPFRSFPFRCRYGVLKLPEWSIGQVCESSDCMNDGSNA